MRVLVVSEHLNGSGKAGRKCPVCGASWTVQFVKLPVGGGAIVFRDGVEQPPEAVLDAYGNNVAVRCNCEPRKLPAN